MTSPRYSFVVPVYNEGEILPELYARLSAILDRLDGDSEVILVDDGSTDRTVEIARAMGLTVITHPENRGYVGNQKTCYRTALEHGADVIVIIHPD